jgi:uncharacterized protein YhjY with autotransporter beta-barrel domain
VLIQEVIAATITLTPTTLPAVLQGVPYAQTLAASGGMGPYSFTISAGTLPTGLILNTNGTITGTPDTAGTFSFTAMATDAFGNTGTGAITLAVTARPDPALNADIRSFIASEDSLAQRFAWTQLDNFQMRFETLRSGTSGSGRNGMSLASRIMDDSFSPQARQSGILGMDARGDMFDQAPRTRDGLDIFAADYGWNFAPGERDESERKVAAGEGLSAFGPRETGTWEFWTGGTLGIGRRDGIDGAARFDFQSEGVSAGLDVKLSDRLALGFGAGLGRERVDIGTDGSTSRAHNGVAAIYGTFTPIENLFLDAVVGGGAMNFDLQRYDGNVAGFAEGTRDGTMRFASLSFGINRSSKHLAWQAFGRIEHFGANLDAYTETGAGIWNLTYLERSVTSTASALGASASMNGLKIGTAPFSPRLRVEWRHEFEEGAAQSIRYADWLDSPTYSVTASELARDQLAVGLGAGLRLDDDWALAADISGRFDRDTEAGNMRLEVSKRF